VADQDWQPVSQEVAASTTEAQHVCPAAEIPPGGRLVTTIAGRSVAIFNRGGEFYALHNRCPHQGAPLCIGELTGVLEARGPGFAFRWTRDGDFVRCPWHGWEFEIATGRNLTDPRVRTKMYPVIEEDGELFVELRGRAD
jgi:3-phenylpropionate/trans-cinnamate dioxygenase ferredoxin subunit